MILVDANLLLYAYDTSSELHDAARGWLESLLNGREAVRFPLVTLLAFVRIGTHPDVFAQPLNAAEAIGHVTRWLQSGDTGIAEPTRHHWSRLADMMQRGQVRGAPTTDAHLAALTIEHGGVLHTVDRGFARYPDLRTLDPLQP